MLIQFSVSNFRSIANTINFSMEAAPTSKRATEMGVDVANKFEMSKTELLKSAVLYGANASGKSNFVLAFDFMKRLILRSSSMQVGESLDVSPFRFIEEFAEKSSTFEMTFFASDQQIYRYGFSITSKIIVEEWLYVKGKTKESCLFERHGQKIDIKSKFSEGGNLENKTRDNGLFLATVAQFNGEISKRIIEWFRSVKILRGTTDQFENLNAISALEDKKVEAKVSAFIKELDLSIQEVFVEERKALNYPEVMLKMLSSEGLELLKNYSGFQAFTKHSKFLMDGQEIGFETVPLAEYESEGTQKLFNFAPIFLEGLESQKIIIVDELDAKLHPLITLALIKMFHSNTGSEHCSQLIFTTHDTNLLTSELFRRDQIWFTEKDKFGATQLYSLYDYKPQNKKIRTDEAYEKNYLVGKYGAIPYLGNLRF